MAGRDNGTLCLITIALNDSLIEDPETYRVAVGSVDQAVMIAGIMGITEVTITETGMYYTCTINELIFNQF